jgi:hypothetical protein
VYCVRVSDGEGAAVLPPLAAPAGARARVVLAATTCKRLAVFLRSMRSLLAMCGDVALVDEFVVVDDNSSHEDRREMARAFPFFRFLLKGPEARGHARSMNMILDLVAAGGFAYCLHTEDDWEFRSPFWLARALALLSDGVADQVLLRFHEGGCAAPYAEHRGIRFRVHHHDLTFPFIPPPFRAWREAQRLGRADLRRGLVEGHGKGCWWPSLSLNPGVVSVRALLATGVRFDEGVDPTYFEYIASFQMWLRGLRVAILDDANVATMPTPTAYALNGTHRQFDWYSCADHRPTGGDPGCPHCLQQRAIAARLHPQSASARADAGGEGGRAAADRKSPGAGDGDGGGGERAVKDDAARRQRTDQGSGPCQDGPGTDGDPGSAARGPDQ